MSLSQKFEIPNAFRIDALTDRPEGFSVETRRALSRTAFLGDTVAHFDSPEQAIAYRNALRREAQFNKVDEYAAAREAVEEARRNEAPQDVTDQLVEAREAAWANYTAKGKKAGFRNIEVQDNILLVDTLSIPFHAYRMFSTPEANPEIRSLSETAAVAMPLLTSDGRLILQHRAIQKPRILRDNKKLRGNALFADVPGASIAGMIDAQPNPDTPGTAAPIDTNYVVGSILKEAGEELGLAPDSFDNVRIVGLAKDHQQIHDEVLLLAQTHLTAAEVYEESRDSNRNKNLGDADFEEKFLDIEGTPEAIHTLLSEVKTPLPPTHAAAMVAAGYLMVLEQHGEAAAHRWRDELSETMNENYQEINRRISRYYERFPEAAKQVPERYWGQYIPARNLTGYSPAYSPEEQGLPNLTDELVRTGLQPETRTSITKAHLFDVDGVLTDPHDRRVIHEELYDELIRRLEAGEPVCLNTGRSSEWVLQNVVESLKNRVSDPATLQWLSVIGEKGNTWAVFNEAGELHRGQTPVLTLPEELREKIYHLIETDPELSQTMTVAVDPYKVTMISPEMSLKPEGVSREEHFARYQASQERFAQLAQKLLEEARLSHLFTVDKTTIATDIESPYAGKDLGADRFLEILKAKNVAYKDAEFITYGDSPSDADMAKELNRRTIKGEFVYVGQKPVDIGENYDFPTIKPQGEYTDATLSYLARSSY